MVKISIMKVNMNKNKQLILKDIENYNSFLKKQLLLLDKYPKAIEALSLVFNMSKGCHTILNYITFEKGKLMHMNYYWDIKSSKWVPIEIE